MKPRAQPTAAVKAPPGPVLGIALLAHGGRIEGHGRPSRLSPAALRMALLQRDLHQAGRSHGLLTCAVGYRAAGYNEGAPVADVETVVARLREQYPGLPICLVGHSMGARASLRAAGADGVASVAGLASWLPPGEPVEQLAGREVLLIDGLRDSVVNPANCLAYAERAQPFARRICRLEVAGGNHSMLRRAGLWHSLVRGFVLHSLGLAPPDPRLETAFAEPDRRALRVAL